MTKPPRTVMLAAPSAATDDYPFYVMLPESVSLNPSGVGPEIWNVAVVPLPGRPATFEFVRQGGVPMRMTLRSDPMSSPFLSTLEERRVTTDGDTRFICTSGAAVVMFNNGAGEDVFEDPFMYGLQVARQVRQIAGTMTGQTMRDAMDRLIGGDPYYPRYFGSMAPGYELLIPSAPGGFIYELLAGGASQIDIATYDAGGARNAVEQMVVPSDRLRRIRFDRVIGAGGALAIGNRGTGVVNVYVNPVERTPTMAGPFGATRIGQTRIDGRATPSLRRRMDDVVSVSITIPSNAAPNDEVIAYPPRLLKPRDGGPVAAATSDDLDEERFQKLAIPPGPCDTCGGKDAMFGGGRECWGCWRARVRRENDAAMAPNRAPAVITARKAPPSRTEERERRRAVRALRVVRRERQTISRSQGYDSDTFFFPDEPPDDDGPAEFSKRSPFDGIDRTFKNVKVEVIGLTQDKIFADMRSALEEAMGGIAMGPPSPPEMPFFRKALEKFLGPRGAAGDGADVSSTSDGGNQAGAVRPGDQVGVVTRTMTDTGTVEIRIDGKNTEMRPDERPREIVGGIPPVDQADIDNLRATTVAALRNFSELLIQPVDQEYLDIELGQRGWDLAGGCAMARIWDDELDDAVVRFSNATTGFNTYPDPSCEVCGPRRRCPRHMLAGFSPVELRFTASGPRQDERQLSALPAFAIGAIADFAEEVEAMDPEGDKQLSVRDLGKRAWNEIRRWAAFSGSKPSDFPVGYRQMLADRSREYNGIPNTACGVCMMGRTKRRCGTCRVPVPVDIFTEPSELGR